MVNHHIKPRISLSKHKSINRILFFLKRLCDIIYQSYSDLVRYIRKFIENRIRYKGIYLSIACLVDQSKLISLLKVNFRFQSKKQFCEDLRV